MIILDKKYKQLKKLNLNMNKKLSLKIMILRDLPMNLIKF